MWFLHESFQALVIIRADVWQHFQKLEDMLVVSPSLRRPGCQSLRVRSVHRSILNFLTVLSPHPGTYGALNISTLARVNTLAHLHTLKPSELRGEVWAILYPGWLLSIPQEQEQEHSVFSKCLKTHWRTLHHSAEQWSWIYGQYIQRAFQGAEVEYPQLSLTEVNHLISVQLRLN